MSDSTIRLVSGSREIILPGTGGGEVNGWFFSDLIDWWGQTDDKYDVTERPQAHGAFSASRSLRSSRAPSFKASFVATSTIDVEAAYDDLSSIGAEGAVEMIVSTPAGSSSRLVTIESVGAEDNHGNRWGTVSVDCIARDPRRYAVSGDVPWESTGPASSGVGRTWPAIRPLVWPMGGSSGRVTLTNSGRAPSAPQFRLVGGFSSVLITSAETGARIGFDRPVPVGSVVTIDTERHVATIDGQSDVSRWLRWREWELVPAGESRSYQFDVSGADGSPVLEGRVLSAWW